MSVAAFVAAPLGSITTSRFEACLRFGAWILVLCQGRDSLHWVDEKSLP
jgi:hypothetical protein